MGQIPRSTERISSVL